MNNEDLPEIQVEEVLDEPSPSEFVIDLDDDSIPVEQPPVPPPPRSSPAVDMTPDASVPPPRDLPPPEFDLEIAMDGPPPGPASPDSEKPAGNPVVPEPQPPKGRRAPLPPAMKQAPLPPTMKGAQPAPAGPPTEAGASAPEPRPFVPKPKPSVPEPKDFLPDSATLDSGTPPVKTEVHPEKLPTPPPQSAPIPPKMLDADEPATDHPAQPAVEPSTDASLDLEALLSGIDLEPSAERRSQPASETPPADAEPEVDLELALEEGSGADEDQAVEKPVAPSAAGIPTLNDVTAEVGAALALNTRTQLPIEPDGWTVDGGPPAQPDNLEEGTPADGIHFEIEAPALDQELAPKEEAAEPPPGPPASDAPPLALDGELPGPSARADGDALSLDGELPPGPPTSDAPPLPLDDGEPPPISTISPETLQPDEQTLATLKKLAGPAVHPEAARAALFAALKGEPYDAHALPDARAMALGAVRVLIATGFSTNELVDSIMHAMTE